MKKQPSSKGQQSATITLRANGSTLSLLATRKVDGTVVTNVMTRDAEKKTARGMTETHANMEAARAHLAKLAEQASKLGWRRGVRVIAQKPDAFSKLPSAPKTVAMDAVQR